MRLGIALSVALTALLGFAVAAGATTSGVTGIGVSTTPDTTPTGYTQPTNYVAPSNDGLGVPSGAIKHVWVIVMENHAYETNFTGFNDNDYLSKTLPQYGAELTNYYGTGHSSLDNYLSMSSGQAPLTDDQNDCNAYTNMSGSVDTSGSLTTNGNYGQFASSAGANAPAGDNGCVYPATVPTLFNQLDANNTSWKVYAQDAANPGITGQNGGTATCDGPDSTIGAAPTAGQAANPNVAFPVDGSANANDQYVAKHSPLPWFQSAIGSGDCTSGHLANLFTNGGTTDQLYNDLQSDSTTPSFSYVVPDNCSNGHDAVCTGNNLSGMAANATTNQPEGTPTNDVGGSYSSDLFLEHVVPEIMNSPAYSDGGMIAIVWDEAYPQFTYSNDSLADSPVATASAYNSLQNDSAGESLFGRSLNWEPSGPNVPNVQSQAGQQLSAGPGFNEYLHRPGSAAVSPLVGCTGGTQQGSNGYYVMASGGCYTGGGSAGTSAAKSLANVTLNANGTATETGSASSLASPNFEGDTVTLPNGVTASTSPVYLGQVSASVPAAVGNTTTTASTDNTPIASFSLVDASGNPVSITAGAGAPVTLGLAAQTTDNDPLYDAFDPTTGGGDTGAILLSPYIKGGTISNTDYNHYSLLRSIEDIFNVSKGNGDAAGYTGSINVSTGLDGAGHLGYAAQPGLDPFGTDVFTDSPLDMTTSTVTQPAVTSTVNKTVTSTVTTVAPGSIFTVTTPGGAKKVEVKVKVTSVPKLTGLTKAEAEQILSSVGLKLGTVKAPKAKKGYTLVVSAASPGAGKSVNRGSKVSLTLKLAKG